MMKKKIFIINVNTLLVNIINYKGNSSSQNCTYCPSGYHFIYNHPGICVSEDNQSNHKYLDEENNTYYECYERYEKCSIEGNKNNHNCQMCEQYLNGSYIYHFILIENVNEEQKKKKKKNIQNVY